MLEALDAYETVHEEEVLGKVIPKHELRDHEKTCAVFKHLVDDKMEELSLDPEATYMLTGGLDGPGRTISVWLAEYGARRLLFCQ
jgi:hypothetical protein